MYMAITNTAVLLTEVHNNCKSVGTLLGRPVTDREYLQINKLVREILAAPERRK